MKLFSLQFFLLLARYWQKTSSSCPESRSKDDKPLVNCTNMDLSDIPPTVELTTEVLILSTNSFVSLAWISYKMFSKIYELDLSHNQVSALEGKSDLDLPTLKILRLSGNRLQELPADAFTAATRLSEIYLNGNQLHTLNAASFRGLTDLEILDLSYNKIRAVPQNLLSLVPSTVLKTFDMEDNCLTILPYNFFSTKPSIPYVYLSKNPWICNCEVDYLKTWLDNESFNVYFHTGPNDIVNDEESVVCDSPSYLKNTPIITLDPEAYCPSTTYTVTKRIETPETSGTLVESTETIYFSNSTDWIINTEAVMMSSVDSRTLHVSTLDSIPTVKSTIQWTEKTFSEMSGILTTQTQEQTFPEKTDGQTTVETTSTPATRRTSPLTATMLPTVLSHSVMMTYPTAMFGEHVLGSKQEWPVKVYCWWLFVGYLCLCILLGLWISVCIFWLLRTYIRVYLPISRWKRATTERPGHKLKSMSCMEAFWKNRKVKTADGAGAISLPMEGTGGVQAVFRSMLFVSVNDEDICEEGGGEPISVEMGQEDTETAGQRCERRKETATVSIKSWKETERWEQEDDVIRKTLYRVVSRDGEPSVCRRVQNDERGDGIPEMKKWARELMTRYSLILREDHVETNQDESGVTRGSEWVVGEWEWKPRESEHGGGSMRAEDRMSRVPLIAKGQDPLPGSTATFTVNRHDSSETSL